MVETNCICMQEQEQEYADVEMYGDTFNKNDIVKNTGNNMILDVVGKLRAVSHLSSIHT